MGEVVNLRLQRKRALRRAAETEAAGNRAAHGVPKAERSLAERRAGLEASRLEGHRLGPASDRAASGIGSREEPARDGSN